MIHKGPLLQRNHQQHMLTGFTPSSRPSVGDVAFVVRQFGQIGLADNNNPFSPEFGRNGRIAPGRPEKAEVTRRSVHAERGVCSDVVLE